MRATIFREDFSAAVERVKPAVASNATIPILAHVLIEAEDGRLRLRASDCYFEIATTVECDVREEGAVTASAAILGRLLKALPERAAVQIDAKTDRDPLAITAGRCRASLLTLPPADFPALQSEAEAQRFTLPGHTLHRLLSGTLFAAGTGILAGIYLHTAKAHSGAAVLRAVATNGHILALADAELPAGAHGLAGVILPAKAIRALIDALKPNDKIADSIDMDVALDISPRLIRATVGATTYTFRPIDGTFPDYARVVPKGGDKQLSVDRTAFMAALDRVSTAAVHGCGVKLDLARGRVQLSGRSLVKEYKSSSYQYEVAGEEEIDAEYHGAALTVGANGGYLASIIDHIDDMAVVARFDDPGSPILLRVGETAERLFVLMPMRV